MSFWNRVGSSIDNLRKHILNLVAILASVFVVSLIIKDMYGGGFEVEAIELPPFLSSKISSKGVAEDLLDGISREWHKAVAYSPISVIRREADEPEIEIGGTNLPLRYVAKLLRRFLGRPIVELSGEVMPISFTTTAEKANEHSLTSDNTVVRIVLRNSEAETNPYFDQSGPMDQIMQNAALASLAQIDAYAAVLAGSQGSKLQQEQALRLAKVILAREPKSAPHGRGYLVEATALYKLGRLDEAERLFNKAVDAFSGSHADKFQLSIAEDGLAIIYTNKKDWRNAIDAVRVALRYHQEFDSALYHQVEVNDYISRSFFGDDKANINEYCSAEAAFQTALNQYDKFISKYPSFYVAYTQLGTMRLLHLRWLRKSEHHPQQCEGIAGVDPLDVEIVSTKKSLEDAVDEDSGNPYGWYESANLSYELQDSQYKLSVTNPPSRLELIRKAVKEYKVATSIEANDFYFWYRYGEALVALAEMDPASHDDALGEAKIAYCHSIETNNKDTGYIDTAETILNKIGKQCDPKSKIP